MTEVEPSSGSDAIVEVEFQVTDDQYPLVALPREAECRLVLEKLLPRDDGRQAQYFSVLGADPERILDVLGEAEHVESRLLVRYESGGLFEFVVTDDCPVCDLTKRGAVPISVTGTANAGTIVAEIFPDDDPAEVISTFLEEYSADLAAKRRKAEATPLVSERELRDTVIDRLTERQREVLFAAYDAGYYERPRQTTGTELAESMGISSATFQQHLRAAEHKLVAFLADHRTD